MPYRCPACDRSILSRRIPLCSFCQHPLPAELLFTPAEVEKIEAEEQARALAATLREAERARRAEETKPSDFGGAAFFMGGDSGGF